MTRGLAAATANSTLNVRRGTTFTGYANVYMKLYTGDPGAAGTVNASALTTRNVITWGAPSGGSMALASVANYSMTATETITDVGFWDAPTGGNFIESWQLTAGVPVINGSILTFNTVTLSYSPLAA